MEDNVKKVMDFIARIAFCEIESDQYEEFLESIKNAIEVELRPLVTDLDTKAQEYANSVTDNKELREMIVNAFKAGYNI